MSPSPALGQSGKPTMPTEEADRATPIAHFDPAERTVPQMLERQAARFGARTLFVAGTARWSFADALRAASAWGAMLRDAGIGAGDRVALLCSNRIEFMQAFLGCAWIGAVAVPINTASRGEALRHVLSNSGARLLVAEADGLQAVLALATGAPLGGAARDASTLPLQSVWLIDAAEPAQCMWACTPFPTVANGATTAAPSRPGDTLAILYTSGTTGPSKGVCCPHAQYYWWGVHSATLLGLRDGETLVTTLPLFHTNALNAFFQALLTGSTLVVEPRFSASSFWESLVRHDATVAYLLGAMVPILLAKEPGALDRAHRARIALAPGVPQQFHAEFVRRFGMRLLEGYGSTETNFVIGALVDVQRPGTMGRVRDGFEARVVDPEDNPLPDGQAGELLLRADEPFAFATGYFGMPEKTVEAWRNLWFHTGDRVIRDADGYFRFRRSPERRDPPPRREHLFLRGGAGAAQPPRHRPRGGLPGAERTRRRRSHGRHRAAPASRARPAGADALLPDAHGLLRGAALSRLCGTPARHRERQGAEVQAARARRHRKYLGPRGLGLCLAPLRTCEPHSHPCGDPLPSPTPELEMKLLKPKSAGIKVE